MASPQMDQSGLEVVSGSPRKDVPQQEEAERWTPDAFGCLWGIRRDVPMESLEEMPIGAEGRKAKQLLIPGKTKGAQKRKCNHSVLLV